MSGNHNVRRFVLQYKSDTTSTSTKFVENNIASEKCCSSTIYSRLERVLSQQNNLSTKVIPPSPPPRPCVIVINLLEFIFVWPLYIPC